MLNKTIVMVKKHEGYRSLAYKCSEGYNTIGYGFNLDNGMSERIASMILMEQLYELELTLEQRYNWFSLLDPVRNSVILNMCFNLGLAGFNTFRKTIEYLESEDYLLAADEMMDSKWAEQVGDRAGELAEMMRTGEWQ